MDIMPTNANNPAAALVWKARPIFISSTFRDMHAERDYLREHGFKDLEILLRERCHYLDTIDLRQGVETLSTVDEAAREMQVLKVCLDEIERSKPFLVAILGDRYGWIPPAARIEAAARDAGLPPTVDVAGRSVTELEILYGVLENPDQQKRSWFYFRTVDRTGMPTDVAAKFPAETPDTDPDSPAGRLKALKDRIKSEMPDRWREYTLKWDSTKNELTGLKEFDIQVVKDLWGDLDVETSAYLRDAPKTWQEADARAVSDFVAERTRGYVERPAVTDTLLDHVLSPATPDADWGIIVTGVPGSGKSSLFGRTHQALAECAGKGELLLLSHAAGIFPLSGQVDRMLRRWITELAHYLGVPDPIETTEQAAVVTDADAPEARMGEKPRITSEDIEQAFAQLLAQAAAKIRVVVLADALNQFEPTIRARHLTWLPKAWPPNARFVATTLPGDAGTPRTEKPGCQEHEVPPVSRDEALRIAERFYRERHHRDVNAKVLNALLDKNVDAISCRVSDTILDPDVDAASCRFPAHGNPLWLALALQEMNLLEADDFERADRDFAHLSPAERMEALQLREAEVLPPDIPGVYSELLARAERTCGSAQTRAFTKAVALSRSGWRDSDLRELLPHISGEAWDELVFAGIRRALGMHVVQRGAHGQWDFFHASLRQTVLQRDLPNEADQRRLHGIIANHLDTLPEDDPIRISETMVHLMGLCDRERAADYLAVQWKMRYQTSAKAALMAAVTVLVQTIQAAEDEAEQNRITAWVTELLQGANNDRTHQVAQVLLSFLNDTLAVTGSAAIEAARKTLLETTRDAMSRLAAADPSNADWQQTLSVSYLRIGDVLRDQGDPAGALRAFRETQSILERLAAADPDSESQQGLTILNRINIGDILQTQGDLPDALSTYRDALAVAERLADVAPHNVVWQSIVGLAHERIGSVLQAQENLAGALEAFTKKREFIQHLASTDPSDAFLQRDLSVSQEKIGDVLRAQGNLSGALRAYRETLLPRERLAAADPSNALWQRDLSVSHEKIGDVLRGQSNLAGALSAYRDSLSLRDRLATANPFNTVWQCDIAVTYRLIGEVLAAQGDLAGALSAYRKARAILEHLVLSNPSNAGWQHDLCASHQRIGTVLRDQGDLTGAMIAYREARTILEHLVLSHPSNAGWQRNLSVVWRIIGSVLQDQGDLSGALCAYRESLAVAERTASADPSSIGWQRNLSVSHHKVGDLLWAQGNLAGALSAYKGSLAVDERLAFADPFNADKQYDLFSSYVKIAYATEQSTPWESKAWWHRAYITLKEMKQRGVMSSSDERYLEELRQKAER